MNLVIIKYNAGNIQSVLYALERIGVSAIVTDEEDIIRSADKIIFPGVGEASTAMKYLRERALDQLIIHLKQPVLGICLGMQLMCKESEENNTHCLGIFNETIKAFSSTNTSAIKIPQIGWNNIYNVRSPLFSGIAENSFCYFVHGYYASLGEHTIATTNYGIDYSSALHKDNFYGTQFHPEKSADIGSRIIKNFITL